MSTNGEEPHPQAQPQPRAPPPPQPQAPVPSQPQAQAQLDPIDENTDWDQLCEEAAEVSRQAEEDEENAIRELDEEEDHLTSIIEIDEEWERLCDEAAEIARAEEVDESIRQLEQLEELEQNHIKYLIDRFQDDEDEEKRYRWRRNIVILLSLGLLSVTVSPLFAAIVPIINVIQEKEYVTIDPNYKTD